MEGWIKTHRKLLDNPIVCKDAEHLAVWMYLLLNATHKELPAVFNGNKITLQPGQLITGRNSISERLSVHDSKVQRILKRFESEQQIEQQTGNKNRLVSILRWSDYQSSEQQNDEVMNNKRTTTEQQLNTNKNVKTVKNEKEEEIYYLEHVKMTEKEYTSLLGLMTDKQRNDYMERFNVWITGQKPDVQKRRSAYLSIRKWYKDDQEKSSNHSISQTGTSIHKPEKKEKEVELYVRPSS